MRNVGAGALSSFLGGRSRNKQQAALTEQARLKDDDDVLKEAGRRKAAYDTLQVLMPNATPEQLLPMAKSVVNGDIDISEIIPKQTEQKGVAAEYEALSNIYGPDKAKTMLSNKYQPKDGDGDGTKSVSQMPGE
ncbi:unnamed protein product, partial [marine sediment metagenome]